MEVVMCSKGRACDFVFASGSDGAWVQIQTTLQRQRLETLSKVMKGPPHAAIPQPLHKNRVLMTGGNELRIAGFELFLDGEDSFRFLGSCLICRSPILIPELLRIHFFHFALIVLGV